MAVSYLVGSRWDCSVQAEPTRVPPKPVQAPSLMGTSRAVIGF
jgi:hypothetical protein